MPSLRSQAIAEQLGCVRVKDLGCADTTRCWELGFCAFSRDEARRAVMEKPEPKRAARIKDPRAIKAKMRGEKKCRCGCGQPATDGHHVVPRSLGGDDLRENIVGLAHECHMEFEFHVDGREEVGARIGENLRDDEVDYVLRKLAPRAFGDAGPDDHGPGWEFLNRYYGLERPTTERSVA